ncbi:Microspherule protein 1 [Plecturocebus cupreus]
MASGTASHSEDEESLAGQNRASSQALGTIPRQKSSSRFIKRKKFHDEQMESSLTKEASRVEPGHCSGSEPSSSEKKRLACQATRQLYPDDTAAIQSKALFSKAKEQLLSKVGSTSQLILETFQDLLHRHPDAFYLACTAKALQAHWQLMKQFYPLEGQEVQSLPKADQVLNFSDAEDLTDDGKLKNM